MPDFVRIRELVDQLERETNEAAASRAAVGAAQESLETARVALNSAIEVDQKEQDERIASLQQLIAALQAEVGGE